MMFILIFNFSLAICEFLWKLVHCGEVKIIEKKCIPFLDFNTMYMKRINLYCLRKLKCQTIKHLFEKFLQTLIRNKYNVVYNSIKLDLMKALLAKTYYIL